MASLDSLKNLMPTKAGLMSSFSTSMHFLTYAVIVFVILVIAGIIIFVVWQNKKFNKKIRIFTKINGRIEEVKGDRARELPIGKGGDKVFYFRRMKSYKARPEIQTGRNTYWYFVREDGEFVNIGIEDIDMKMKLANVRYIHPDMRYAKIALERNLFARHQADQQSFMQKYGIYLIPLAVFAMLGLIMYFVADKMLANSDSINAGTQATKEVMQELKQILVSLDSITKTSGMKAGG